MIAMHHLYVLAGLLFAAFALLGIGDRSNPKWIGNSLFWGLMALSLLAGDAIGDFGNGLIVLALASNIAEGQVNLIELGLTGGLAVGFTFIVANNSKGLAVSAFIFYFNPSSEEYFSFLLRRVVDHFHLFQPFA